MSATITVLPLTSVATTARHLYRCYLLAGSGHIQALETLSCRGDEEAEALAELIFEQRDDCTALELWDVGRKMLRLSRDPTQPLNVADAA